MHRLRFAALAASVFALSTTTVQAQGYGTIKGQVTLPNPPDKMAINVTQDKDHCLSKGPLMPTEVLVDPKSKGLKNVWVYLRPDSDNRREKFPTDKIKPELAKAEPKTHAIDQPCCQFEPRILAVREGDLIEVKNSAPVPHNINMSADDPSYTFNITLQPGKSFKPAAGIANQSFPATFKCDIHPWMAGQFMVFDHPYFTLTDEQGNFEIKDVPAGKWRVVYRHEKGYHKGRDGALGFVVDVPADGVANTGVLAFEVPQ